MARAAFWLEDPSASKLLDWRFSTISLHTEAISSSQVRFRFGDLRRLKLLERKLT